MAGTAVGVRTAGIAGTVIIGDHQAPRRIAIDVEQARNCGPVIRCGADPISSQARGTNVVSFVT